MQLKNRGLNTTAIRLALENTEESEETSLTPKSTTVPQELVEMVSLARQIVEQNTELMQQNRRLEQRMEKLEQKIDRRNLKGKKDR